MHILSFVQIVSSSSPTFLAVRKIKYRSNHWEIEQSFVFQESGYVYA